MADPLSASDLLAAFEDEGVRVREVDDWRDHHRGDRGDGWGPVHGIMLHHTATSGTDETVRLCQEGRSDLPGPLCHWVADKEGRLHLVGHGRANHAGGGDPDVLEAVIREERKLPHPSSSSEDGNARFYGIEAINLGDGEDPWPEDQLECVARAAAAVCRAHGWNEYSVVAHAEWQSDKIDPRGPGRDAAAMVADFRQRVAALLG